MYTHICIIIYIYIYIERERDRKMPADTMNCWSRFRSATA